jgi:hypothetical protein
VKIFYFIKRRHKLAESQETSDYPGALDNWVTLTNKEDLAEQSDINKMKAAIEAVQTELGTDPAGTATDVTSRLSRMMNGSGAFAQGTAFPTSPTPVEGQVFYRTDENTPYVYDGSNWIPFVGSSYELFTSSGTFTVPGGITTVYLTMVGGGGGGASGQTGLNSYGGGGGAGGQTIIFYPLTVTPADSITVTVGAAANGGASLGANGSNGVASAFGTLSAAGGSGGTGITGATATVTSMNAANASSSSGTAGGLAGKFTGGNGGNGHGTGASNYGGGGGGGSYFGAGGAGGNASNNGSNATGFGSGGGGAGSSATTGGKGSAGFVLVSW